MSHNEESRRHNRTKRFKTKISRCALRKPYSLSFSADEKRKTLEAEETQKRQRLNSQSNMPNGGMRERKGRCVCQGPALWRCVYGYTLFTNRALRAQRGNL